MRRATVLAMGMLLVVLVVGCSDDEPATSADTTAAESDDLVAQATLPTSASTTAVAPPEVAIETTSLGDVLVDADGLTLYVFLSDTPGASTCIDACAQTWPPLITSSLSVSAELDVDDFSLITRPDGTQQLAVADRPLYRFAGDIEAGDTAGQGFNDLWYVVGPDGAPIEAS